MHMSKTATGIHVVGLGGTLRPSSSSGKALKFSLDYAATLGAEVQLFTADALQLPLYDPESRIRDPKADRLIAALRQADGIIISSPGYHGSISGAVKNVLDFTEEMSRDSRPYFDGRAIGCIAVAAGWQAAGATLHTLRAIVHSLRGWPTPMGVMMNSSEPQFDAEGRCLVPQAEMGLKLMVDQVLSFASRKHPG
jgi:FMN reductase